MINMEKKKKYIAVFMTKEQDAYTIQKKKKINPLKQVVSIFNHSFIIDIAKYTFSENLSYYYLIDIHKCQLAIKKFDFQNKKKDNLDKQTEIKDLTIEQLDDIEYNSELTDSVVVNSLVGQLTSNLNNKIGKRLYDIIVGLAIGGLLGFIIGFFVGGG